MKIFSSTLFLLVAAGLRVAWAQNPYYTVETVALPKGEELVGDQIGGIATLPSGRIAVAFHRGDLWILDPQDETWTQFAEGLHEPLGILPLGEDDLLVSQRPEVTRLRDTDGDGSADRYECFYDGFGITGNYHEYHFGPALGPDGGVFISLNAASNGASIHEEIRGEWSPIGMNREDFYKRPWSDYKTTAGRMYTRVPYRGCVVRIDPESGEAELYATGFRSPDGIGFDAEGRLIITDNQGDWLGTSKAYVVQKGGFHGHPASLIWKEGWTRNPLEVPAQELDEMRVRAAVLLPQGILANSPTQPIVDTSEGTFGPFAGQTIVGEMNRSRLFRLLIDEYEGVAQGAAIPFLDGSGLAKGCHRMAFGNDGSLYVGSTQLSWAGGRGLRRITWKGETPPDILEMRRTKNGFALEFTVPMDPKTLTAEALTSQSYRYEYHEKYGSDQLDSREEVPTGVSLSDDGKSLEITLSEIRAGFVYQFGLEEIRTAEGKALANSLICYTNLVE